MLVMLVPAAVPTACTAAGDAAQQASVRRTTRRSASRDRDDDVSFGSTFSRPCELAARLARRSPCESVQGFRTVNERWRENCRERRGYLCGVAHTSARLRRPVTC